MPLPYFIEGESVLRQVQFPTPGCRDGKQQLKESAPALSLDPVLWLLARSLWAALES